MWGIFYLGVYSEPYKLLQGSSVCASYCMRIFYLPLTGFLVYKTCLISEGIRHNNRLPQKRKYIDFKETWSEKITPTVGL